MQAEILIQRACEKIADSGSQSELALAQLLGAILVELVAIRKATEQANEEEEPGATTLGDMSFPFTAGETLNGDRNG